MPPGVDEQVCLQAVYDDTLQELRTELIRDGTKQIQSFAIILHEEGLAFTVIMEPRRQFQTIRDALLAVKGSFAFVYVHDGHIDIGEPPLRREALLFVKGSRQGVEARAYAYTRTPFGARFDDEEYPCPAHLVEKYREVFAP